MTAADKAGIAYGRKVKDGFTFHDLRRTAKTNMRKAGIDRNVRNSILGHESKDMDNRYDIVDDDDLIKAIDQLEVFLVIVDQTVDQGAFDSGQGNV
jgi:integrase